MTTASPPIELNVIHSITDVAPSDWNALTDPNDPFTEHAFLALLEESESVGKTAGWVPVHLLAHRENSLVGAVPLYLKNNSYGEYIFDWGWAQAAQRAGIPYYPKLVSAVPFTPASGRRLLAHDDDTIHALIDGIHGIAEATNALSIHILFCTQRERYLLEKRPEFIGRSTHQFHWDNNAYADFDDWLSQFRSRRRKEVRRERLVPEKMGVTVRTLRGNEISAEQWSQMRRFYERTVQKKHATAYLSDAFFSLGFERLKHTAVLFAAEQNGNPVAASLCFQRGMNLMGRYWGCDVGFESLHFELCYHKPIELCIDNGWTHFEAGAQGMHKLQRGLAPAITHSAHHLRHAGLHNAVAESMKHEVAQLESEMAWCETKLPFRRTDLTTG